VPAGLLISLLTLALSAPLPARDVWVLGGVAETRTGCETTRWIADPVLYNNAGTTATVRLVHISNGGGDNLTGDIPAHDLRTGTSLGAVAGSVLWITHLDVPDTIQVEGRMELFGVNQCTMFPPDPRPITKVTTPVFTQLTPPGTEQVHLGTDLGRQPVRINVGIYNAGNVPARANIQVRLPECQDMTPAPTQVTVPADTVMQVPLGNITCTTGATWPSAVAVSMDQSGMSFVSTLSNETAASATINMSHD
jgi:hypothetical protein